MNKAMTTNEIRQAFLDYFKELGHEVVPSSSLVPANDPTLLFTNAGMVQFKGVFLGIDECSYKTATSSQRCVRAGGKHNDLENVGYTKRHHTFFEMLGNFSFGDYFKRDAISFAWKFLTEVLHIPKERLWVTVFRDDDESANIWLNDIAVDPDRLSRCGESDNFWSMGDTGPCGPCTEIFYDHGPSVAGGPPGSPDQDGDRYVEVWNLVFMQYNRTARGDLELLPTPCVDTGMGLERIATVVQGVHDNYDIELFQKLLTALGKIIGVTDHQNKSMRVIVDHIRSSAFLITDGISPSNEGRGYVLRRIIRRAIRHGHKLGKTDPFFYQLTQPLVEIMGEAYPELSNSKLVIEQLLHEEEVQFSRTLSKGLKILDHEVAELKSTEIPGHLVFQLYDTYGFPPDLTADIARERGLTLDYPGFESAMQRQREMSQASQQFNVDMTQKLHIAGETEFTGYESLHGDGSVTALLQDNKPVTHLSEGQHGIVVLDKTPFYAESGGQVGDKGYLYFESGQFRVHDTQKYGKVYLHIGELVKGVLNVDDAMSAEVDESRYDIILNHSATHLLHEALRRVLGEHVIQKGSLVEARRLRFDFSHPKPLTPEQLHSIENLVNQQIRENLESHVEVTTLEEAKEKGAMAIFDEKYGDTVRMVKMGDFSTELCGGTHAAQSGDIGLFKIVSESAVSSGIRRIEAVTGHEALVWVNKGEEQLRQLGVLLKSRRDELAEKIEQTLDHVRELNKEVTRLKQKLAAHEGGSLIESAVDINGVKLLVRNLDGADRDAMRVTMDQLKSQMDRAAILLASVQNSDVLLVAGVTKNLTDKIKAGDLLNHVALQVGGKGGGRPDLAQGGGDKPEALPQALNSVEQWIRERV